MARQPDHSTEPETYGALRQAIDGYAGEPVSCAALKLLPLVFVRPGELRLAKWADYCDALKAGAEVISLRGRGRRD